MRGLTGMLTAAGFVVGIAATALWHWSRSTISGGWTLYAPLNGPVRLPTHHPGWWPTLLVFPVLGALVGAFAGFVLGRLGWAMVRRGGHDESALA